VTVIDEHTQAEADAAARSGDAHWQAKLRKLRERQLPTRTLEFFDEEARETRDRTNIENIAAQADEKMTADEKAAAQAAYDEAQAAYDDSLISLTFKALPRPEYEALISAHPPTDDQERLGEAYNVDTFAPALIAACSLDPMTEADARDLLASLNQGESGAMFQTCVQINGTIRVSVGKGSRPTHG